MAHDRHEDPTARVGSAGRDRERLGFVKHGGDSARYRGIRSPDGGMTEAGLAYMAGTLDGEGALMVKRAGRPPRVQSIQVA
jgi:hypothetical protein